MEKFYVNEGGEVCGHNGALDECEITMLLNEREQLMDASWAAMQDRAMSLPDLAIKFDEQAQRITTLEAENRELRLSKARVEAAKATLMQGLVSSAANSLTRQEQARQCVKRADEAALSVREEDLVRVQLNEAGRLDGGEESSG